MTILMAKRKLNHRITISLDEETFKNVSRLAAEGRVSVGWIVRHAVDFFLKSEEGGQLLLPFHKK